VRRSRMSLHSMKPWNVPVSLIIPLARIGWLPSWGLSLSVLCALVFLCGCSSARWRATSADEEPIKVGQPEIYENADLQSRLDQLKGQLAALNGTDQASITSAIPNVQGVTSTQSGVNIQILGPGSPTLPPAPAAIAAATGPSVGPASRGVLDQQYQLSSQIIGYGLLLTGSDFARYTTNGAAKDRIVIGFPITINAGKAHRDQAAEVKVTYYPPNAGQFYDPKKFSTVNPRNHDTQAVCSSKWFSPGDPNAEIACQEQEQSPTIINILPSETTYNTVGISSKSATLGLGTVIGTVNAGITGGRGQQTQYFVAAQDTVAMQESGPIACKPDAPRSEEGVQCVANSRGVAFKWQFRPVLGEHAVRSAGRWLYVQLAIPYAHRPYPNYGGVVEIRTSWVPFDASLGLMKGPGAEEKKTARAVFGHPFMGPIVSKVNVKDLGGGSVLVIVTGKYLIGATVRVGSTVLNASSPGFLTSYNSMQFTTTAQALAQSGAVITASSGVDTPLVATSLCKAADLFGECYRSPDDFINDRLKVKHITIDPVSDSTSQVRIELAASIKLDGYEYHRYFRLHGDVVETSDDRKPEEASQCLDKLTLGRINGLPILVYAGGKAYGFSDLPLQYLNAVDETSTPAPPGDSNPDDIASPTMHCRSKSGSTEDAADSKRDLGTSIISFIAANDSLNASPELKIERLFGDPESDSVVVPFVPENGLTVTSVPPPKSGKATGTARGTAETTGSGGDDATAVGTDAISSSASPARDAPTKATDTKSCDQEATKCEYILSGAWADKACQGLSIPGTHTDPRESSRISFSRFSGHSSCRFSAAQGSKQVTLQLKIRSAADSVKPDELITETLTLPLSSLPSGSTTDSVAAITSLTQASPNFTMVRSVLSEHKVGDVAYITVGIQKLKDQTATLTVANANIVSAIDGNHVVLGVLPGGQVTVSQDTAVTFELRDADPKGVIVTAEGKNGTVSTGKIQFKYPFVINPPLPSARTEVKH
jgi:hypothetical protein